MKIKRNLSILLIVVLLTGILVGCSSDKGNEEFVIMEGTFSEVSILGHMVGQLIEEYTDLDVTYHDAMSTVPFANAVESGEIDLGLSYDGTLLSTLLGYDPSDVPKGKDLFEWANQKGKEDRGLMLTGNLGFENTYALGVKRDFAEKNDIKSISDLKPYTKNLTFGAEHEFFDEEGTVRFKPFNKYYGIKWKDSKSMELAYKYSAIDSNNIDVTMVYTTDGLNVKSDLAMLEDDKNFFPQYYGSFLVRDGVYKEFAETAPNLKKVLTMLNDKIDNETMTQMNYQADVEGKDPDDIAREFLVKEGLIKE